MQSTGEVIGIHTDPRVALAKALLGAALVPPRPGPTGALALLSIADRDKDDLPRLGAALVAAGYRLAATSGTRATLADAGIDAAPVAKLGATANTTVGESDILELIASGTVRLVVNTPTPRSGAVRDAAEIRLAATSEGILCLTAMETAIAAAEALDPTILERLSEVRSLDEWVPNAGRAVDRVAVAAGR
jgi:carbamoyl-phosphate synthase large subunit